MQSVEKVLTGLELNNKPRLLVFNKCDQVHPMDVVRFGEGENAVAISALKREGFDTLLKKSAEYLWPEDSEGFVPSPEIQTWSPSLD
jgi:GTP-binding protein HflX